MQNLFKNTEFMMGVTQYKNLPEDTGTEILLAGRSNAGKSSALNALTENKKRDQFVLELCKKNNIPIQISMGGGYSISIKDILEAHSNTYRLAQEIFF